VVQVAEWLTASLSGLAEKRGERGGHREDASSVKYKSIELCCGQKTEFKSFQMKLKNYQTSLLK